MGARAIGSHTHHILARKADPEQTCLRRVRRGRQARKSLYDNTLSPEFDLPVRSLRRQVRKRVSQRLVATRFQRGQMRQASF